MLPEAKYVFLCFIKAFIEMCSGINFTVREWSLFIERWLVNGRGRRGGGGQKSLAEFVERNQTVIVINNDGKRFRNDVRGD